jgi:hypothetical protein
MISWLTRNKQNELLGAKLREVVAKQTPLADERKKLMKERLVSRIDEAMSREEIGFEQLAEQLEKLNLTVEPSAAFKQHARQDILDVVTLRSQRLWLKDVFREMLALRRTWATVTACAVLVTGTFGYLMQTPRVSAAKVSQIDAVRGTAMVERGEAEFDVENGFLIEEGDRLVTGNDGYLDVMFVDDSLLTVGPNTEVIISELWADPENEASTSVLVDVESGQVFAQIVNLSPSSSLFTVRTEAGEFSVDRKAHFDLKVEGDETEARVFSNLLDFDVTSEGVTREGTLGPNLHMMVNGNLLIENIEDVETLKNEDLWVKTNLENHAAYLERLENFYVTRVEQQAGALPGDSFYFLERGGEEVKRFLSFNENSKMETEMALAEQRFSEAAVLMRQGRTEESQELLIDYQMTLVDLAARMPEQEEAVRAALQETKKIVEGFSINDSIREAKSALEETEILLVTDEAEKQSTHLETTADRLGLAFDLIQIKAYGLALKSLEDYESGLTDVLEGLSELEMETRKQFVLEILDQKLRDLLMLKMIASELEILPEGDDAKMALMGKVDSLYADTLYQINTLVINLKERAVLQLGTFLYDAKGEEVMQRDILNRLKKTVPLELEYMQVINDLEAFYEDEETAILFLQDDRLVIWGDEQEEEAPLLEEYQDEVFEQTGTEFDGEAESI